MWSRLWNVFKKKTNDSPEDGEVSRRELIDEMRDLKKVLRRQGIFFESIKKEFLEKLEEKDLKAADGLFEFTDAFFHLDASLRQAPDLSSNQYQAIEIVWQHLESLLASTGIEIIRQAEVNYDPRLYESVGNVSEGDGNPMVKEILLPGYIYKGQVIKPAKAVVELRRPLERRNT
jgi:molecular chaperone GrpE (heat shock protein)